MGLQESGRLASGRGYRDVQARRKRFPVPAAPHRRLCREGGGREERRGFSRHAVGWQQDRHRRRSGTSTAAGAVSTGGVHRFSLRRGPGRSPGGGRCHGLSESHGYLWAGQFGGHGLRRPGGRLPGQRTHRRHRGRRDGRVGPRPGESRAPRAGARSQGLPRERGASRLGRERPRIRGQSRGMPTEPVTAPRTHGAWSRSGAVAAATRPCAGSPSRS